MSKTIKLMSIIGVAIALSPAFAHARNGERSAHPVRNLIEIPGAVASTAQGRSAERAPSQPIYTLSDPVMETAGIDGASSSNTAGS